MTDTVKQIRPCRSPTGVAGGVYPTHGFDRRLHSNTIPCQAPFRRTHESHKAGPAEHETGLMPRLPSPEPPTRPTRHRGGGQETHQDRPGAPRPRLADAPWEPRGTPDPSRGPQEPSARCSGAAPFGWWRTATALLYSSSRCLPRPKPTERILQLLEGAFIRLWASCQPPHSLIKGPPAGRRGSRKIKPFVESHPSGVRWCSVS